MKKVCVITSTRAEYGLLRFLMQDLKASRKIKLQIIATGSHLSQKHGNTYKIIEKDGFKIQRKIKMNLEKDSSFDLNNSMGQLMIGFSKAFSELKPDLVLILGDRYEMLSAATSAMMFKIPIAHIHGGEATFGLIDEAIRHSITKMSHLHFVAAKDFKQRVIQLGEDKKNVFQVGALGLDGIENISLLNKKDTQELIDFKFKKINFLVTYHPVTLENNSSHKQFSQILKAFESWPEAGIIFTAPNHDHDSRVIFRLIESFAKKNKNVKFFESMGQLKYLSTMKHVDAVIGNSSSGLIETPSFKIGTVNIGERQKGRLMAESVINCNPSFKNIRFSLNRVLSKEFKKKLKTNKNPYGKPGASKKIVKILEDRSFDDLLIKNFRDY
jgi:GDP/UDP-N,N'-diacetylbacillosamine 2-epimerase (hydrolysing)|tara:strand:+ start:641 stop:1792 length:1152 start_codon:yes stop_codon:yes gene_type:complete